MSELSPSIVDELRVRSSSLDIWPDDHACTACEFGYIERDGRLVRCPRCSGHWRAPLKEEDNG